MRLFKYLINSGKKLISRNIINSFQNVPRNYKCAVQTWYYYFSSNLPKVLLNPEKQTFSEMIDFRRQKRTIPAWIATRIHRRRDYFIFGAEKESFPRSHRTMRSRRGVGRALLPDPARHDRCARHSSQGRTTGLMGRGCAFVGVSHSPGWSITGYPPLVCYNAPRTVYTRRYLAAFLASRCPTRRRSSCWSC